MFVFYDRENNIVMSPSQLDGILSSSLKLIGIEEICKNGTTKAILIKKGSKPIILKNNKKLEYIISEYESEGWEVVKRPYSKVKKLDNDYINSVYNRIITYLVNSNSDESSVLLEVVQETWNRAHRKLKEDQTE